MIGTRGLALQVDGKRDGVAEVWLGQVSRQVVLRHPPFGHRELVQVDGDRLCEILRLEIQQVELRGVRIFQAGESRIEVPDRHAQVVGGTGVSDREIQVAITGKIDAMIRGVLPRQHVGVAATRARRFFGKPAFEMKARLIHPVHLGQRLLVGRRQEIGRARREGVDFAEVSRVNWRSGRKRCATTAMTVNRMPISQAADWLGFR